MKVAELKEWLRDVPNLADIFIDAGDGWKTPVLCLTEEQFSDGPTLWSVVIRSA